MERTFDRSVERAYGNHVVVTHTSLMRDKLVRLVIVTHTSLMRDKLVRLVL